MWRTGTAQTTNSRTVVDGRVTCTGNARSLTARSSRRITFAGTRLERPERRRMRRKLTPRGQERREQLIACAARLFAERGYHPTSVADIVDDAGRRQGRLLLVLRSRRKSCSPSCSRRRTTSCASASSRRSATRPTRSAASSSASARRSSGSTSTASTSRSSSSRPPTRRSHRCSPATARSRSPTRSATSRTASSRADPRRRPRDARPRDPRRRRRADPPRTSSSATSPSTHVADLAVAFCLQGLTG